MKFEVSRRIREEFENGRQYYALHGKTVAKPSDPKRQLAESSLVWHNENCYRGKQYAQFARGARCYGTQARGVA
jgi:hypothetical protein